jgi:hypothetical protein
MMISSCCRRVAHRPRVNQAWYEAPIAIVQKDDAINPPDCGSILMDNPVEDRPCR